MKKDLEEKAFFVLEAMLNAISSGIEKAPVFISSLANEYVAYFVIENGAIALASLIMVIVSLYMIYKGMQIFKRDADKPYYDRSGVEPFLFMVGGLILLISFGLFVNKSISTLQAYYAPKAFLIESVRNSGQ
jgi:uncharacterized membrane protein